MRFNETTHIISMCVLILTAVYTLVYSGISGVLLCAAIAFIAGAFIHEIELVVAVTILFVLCYNLFLKRTSLMVLHSNRDPRFVEVKYFILSTLVFKGLITSLQSIWTDSTHD